MNTSLQFQVQYLRQQSMQRTVESLTIFIAALFTIMLLPSFLGRYVFTDLTPLSPQPAIMEAIPLVAFLVGALYFIYAVVSNVMREMKIRQLETQLMNETRTMPASASVNDLQAAMIKVERSSSKTTRGRKSSRR